MPRVLIRHQPPPETQPVSHIDIKGLTPRELAYLTILVGMSAGVATGANGLGLYRLLSEASAEVHGSSAFHISDLVRHLGWRASGSLTVADRQ